MSSWLFSVNIKRKNPTDFFLADQSLEFRGKGIGALESAGVTAPGYLPESAHLSQMQVFLAAETTGRRSRRAWCWTCLGFCSPLGNCSGSQFTLEIAGPACLRL